MNTFKSGYRKASEKCKNKMTVMWLLYLRNPETDCNEAEVMVHSKQ